MKPFQLTILVMIPKNIFWLKLLNWTRKLNSLIGFLLKTLRKKASKNYLKTVALTELTWSSDMISDKK